ncbi:hypothetical protein FRACYDRAFT_243832 [Fragilariopsis cylindrus CCMP1102]|uniref:Uncharacterized protein n=1 Tax=Fragilariopsis cylindrus CCMP1102 TaxID=635003 RepID=A0A1E7F330_9STRA|nr:hypothetical protein FRACYDRAFT_243832 [Fragilariopsis cylindrus CCMP1102]|eukprot:OEU12580.1 hypothetical protein FRACYDRAFT_243832 [Fragilariopsis cylindrus CCMP1102]
MSLPTTKMQRNQMKKEKEDEDDGKKDKRVSALRKKITKRDTGVYGKIQDALEHVVVTGAKVRRENWRLQKFLRSSQHDQDRGVEYIRIYGNNKDGPFKRGCPMKPWPLEGVTTKKVENHHIHRQQNRKTKTRKSDDTEWNVEHGDSVPPILFRMARLSQEYPSEEQLRIFNKDASLSRMKTLQSTDITLDETDIPRALIERCWERAVHAASNSMFAPIAATTTTATTTNQTPSMIPVQQSTSSRPCHQLHHTGLQIDMNKPLSQESCRIKCKSLGIDIESERAKAIAISEEATASASASACPRCFRSFENSDGLQEHYYGNDTTKGCCWPLVRPQHLELIDKLLQSRVQSQTDQLLNVIMTQAAAPSTNNDADEIDDENTASKERNVTNKKPKRLLDWKNVRSFLQGALDDSTSLPIGASNGRIDARHSVQQSLQTTVSNESEPPLILNQMVLDAVNRRLVDRYANVPR